MGAVAICDMITWAICAKHRLGVVTTLYHKVKSRSTASNAAQGDDLFLVEQHNWPIALKTKTSWRHLVCHFRSEVSVPPDSASRIKMEPSVEVNCQICIIYEQVSWLQRKYVIMATVVMVHCDHDLIMTNDSFYMNSVKLIFIFSLLVILIPKNIDRSDILVQFCAIFSPNVYWRVNKARSYCAEL